MEAVIEAALKHVPDPDVRRAIYRHVIPALENQDWCDLPELFGMDNVYRDLVLNEMHPGRYDEEDFEEEEE